MQNVVYEEHFPEFITITCYEWLHLIGSLEAKSYNYRKPSVFNGTRENSGTCLCNHGQSFSPDMENQKRIQTSDVQRDFALYGKGNFEAFKNAPACCN
ncbi:MAG: hypothetical protein IPM95_00045 [Sphingobacteriales bacterium]|nr:hypothetical protein [Sphingobacteriales bacterium]